MQRQPLWLDRDAMRRLGHQTVDAIAGRLTRPRTDEPVVRAATPEEMAARLAGPPPEGPRAAPAPSVGERIRAAVRARLPRM